jgi:DNA-binding GntR family transcriptional regulator
MAAALAAQNITKKDLAKLKLLVAEERTIYKKFIASGLRRGLSGYHDINEAFHSRIAKLSGNEVLYEQIVGLLQKCRIYLILFDTYDQMDFNPSRMASPIEHEEIISHLSKGNSQGAEEAMMNHLDSTLDGMDFNIVLPDDHITI